MKSCFGNSLGFKFDGISLEEIFGYSYGSFILEVNDGEGENVIGQITDDGGITFGDEKMSLNEASGHL